MTRRLALRPLAPAVSGLAESLAPQTRLARVQGAWEEAVGAAIARESTPVSERAGVVSVACSSSAWAHELELMAPGILARLAALLGPAAPLELRFSARLRR